MAPVTPDLHFELLYGNYQLKEKDRQGILGAKKSNPGARLGAKSDP